jgi:hypothetical protein
MLRNWKKDNNDLPRFPVMRKQETVKVFVALDSAIDEMSPVLASWFMNLSPSRREGIILDAYAKEKLGEDWE